MNRQEAYELALKWAAEGIHTFPITWETKAPLTSHGFHNASTDPEVLKTLFKPWKTDTGEQVRVGVYPGPAGYVVWDVDVKDGKPGRDSLEALAEKHPELHSIIRGAPTVQTPSGGFHLWFKKPIDVETGEPISIGLDNGTRLGRGIDVRADGGYVATGDGYEWLLRARPSIMGIEGIKDAPRLPEFTIPLFVAHGEAGTRALTEDDWEQFAPETRATVEWLIEHGTAHSPVIKQGGSHGSYVMLAHGGRQSLGCAVGGASNPGSVNVFSEGWELDNGQHLPGDDHPYELGELQNVYETGSRTGALTQLVTLNQDIPEKATPKSLREMFEAELYDLDTLDSIEPPEFLIEGFLVRDSLAEVFADPGVGKSFLGIDWMMHVADGRDWHGCEVKKPEPVLYIIGEGKAGMKSRTKVWRQHHGDSEMLRRNVKMLGRAVNLANGAEVAAVMPLIKNHRPALVIIDTLARAAVGADGNGDKDMGIVIEHAEQIRRATGACVLIIHHTGHSNKERGRGSSAVAGALQTDMKLTRSGDRLILETTKQKDHEHAPKHTMRIQQVTLNNSEDTSLVILPLDEGGDTEQEPEWMSTRKGELYQALLSRSVEPQTSIPKGSWLEGVQWVNSGNQYTQIRDWLISHGHVVAVGKGVSTTYYAVPLTKAYSRNITVSFSEKEAKR